MLTVSSTSFFITLLIFMGEIIFVLRLRRGSLGVWEVKKCYCRGVTRSQEWRWQGWAWRPVAWIAPSIRMCAVQAAYIPIFVASALKQSNRKHTGVALSVGSAIYSATACLCSCQHARNIFSLAYIFPVVVFSSCCRTNSTSYSGVCRGVCR